MYSEDEMLMLSGIQHYVFCPRQWALIHIEQLWGENYLTMEGQLLHSRVDDPTIREKNGSDIFTLRGIRLASQTLGFSGIADAIEIRPFADAPKNKRQLLSSKNFEAIPVEFKRGHKKLNDCDRIQVCAQAMIFEEMTGVEIKKGTIFYWEERHREYVEIDDSIRSQVHVISENMHKILSSGKTPKPIYSKSCKACSLYDLCNPKINNKSVAVYLNYYLDEKIT